MPANPSEEKGQFLSIFEFLKVSGQSVMTVQLEGWRITGYHCYTVV